MGEKTNYPLKWRICSGGIFQFGAHSQSISFLACFRQIQTDRQTNSKRVFSLSFQGRESERKIALGKTFLSSSIFGSASKIALFLLPDRRNFVSVVHVNVGRYANGRTQQERRRQSKSQSSGRSSFIPNRLGAFFVSMSHTRVCLQWDELVQND